MSHSKWIYYCFSYCILVPNWICWSKDIFMRKCAFLYNYMALASASYECACLAVFSGVFWECCRAQFIYFFLFFLQKISGRLMKQLCWFKRITSLLSQIQLIICYIGITRLTLTPLTIPSDTTHTNKSPQQHANSLVKTDLMKRGSDKRRWKRQCSSKTIRTGGRGKVKWQKGKKTTVEKWRWDTWRDSGRDEMLQSYQWLTAPLVRKLHWTSKKAPLCFQASTITVRNVRLMHT